VKTPEVPSDPLSETIGRMADAARQGPAVLQHLQFSSLVDVGLWSELAAAKLHSMRLSDEPAPIWGAYALPLPPSRNRDPSVAAPPPVATFCVERTSLDPSAETPAGSAVAPGLVKVVNTLEDFKETDKKGFIDSLGQGIVSDIDSGEAVRDPSRLIRWAMLVYSNLKAYTHTYWLAFPALCTPSAVQLVSPAVPLGGRLSSAQMAQLHTGCAQLRGDKGPDAFFVVIITGQGSGELSVLPLRCFEEESVSTREDTKYYFGFMDPSSLPNNPGWPLRNLLYLMHRRWSLTKASIICYRDQPNIDSEAQPSASVIIDVELPPPASKAPPTVVGWEANARGKLGARQVDLSPFLDPKRRAIESADLNLNLMRWRFMPDLDIERIANMNCLLLGSGTLGCNVARSLLSWGARKITFLDYGKVSFSNPTRQWLFEFEDCSDPANPTEGRPKAAAAADRLSRIVPNVVSRGVELPIPMPGHPINKDSEDKVKGEVAVLDALIEGADVVFLLTDTRESRWLPTLMCVAKSKPCINVALGFDTFVVMRHGVQDSSLGSVNGGSPCNVGCYFCNDVVAPTDSTKNRTLDQQCTTTRPGLSSIASAIAVELTVSLLHHPKGPLAPPDLAGQVGDETDSMMGLVPHQIRGFLSNFSNVLIHGNAFEGCTACSPKIVEAYRQGGWDFLLRACNETDFLETFSGLKALKEASDAAMADWDNDSDDEHDM